MQCTVCGNTGYALGLCNSHYKKYRAYGDPRVAVKPRGSLFERFSSKVDRSPDHGGCWMWGGGKTRKGYGVIQEGGRGSKLLLAHRVSYEQFHGSIPDGLSVLHSCDHPWCVNPAHLRSGTQSENIKEAYSKGRKISPSRSGEDSPRSKLTAEQVKMIRENPSVGHTRMAAMFGVTPSCIRNVRSGRTWAKPSPGHVA